jgi:hypothetical protein
MACPFDIMNILLLDLDEVIALLLVHYAHLKQQSLLVLFWDRVLT